MVGQPIHPNDMLLRLFDHDDKLTRGDQAILPLLEEGIVTRPHLLYYPSQSLQSLSL